MHPVMFPESNFVLGKPAEMTHDECVPLPVWRDGQQCISCWQLTDAELAEIVKTKRVYLSCITGWSQPPVWLAIKNPFTTPEAK
jgi:hypothetical protein